MLLSTPLPTATVKSEVASGAHEPHSGDDKCSRQAGVVIHLRRVDMKQQEEPWVLHGSFPLDCWQICLYHFGSFCEGHVKGRYYYTPQVVIDSYIYPFWILCLKWTCEMLDIRGAAEPIGPRETSL